MSSEPGPPTPRDATRVPEHRYRRTVLVLILGLALTAGALTTVTAIRGPHVRQTIGDLGSLVQRDGARLRLQTDQPLTADSIDGLTVTPSAPVEVSLSDNAIDVRFGSLLDYGTEYRITAPRLTGLYTGADAPLDVTFRTPSPDIFTLVRDSRTSASGQDAPDSVLRHRLRGGVDEVNDAVFSAPRIQEYAVAGGMLAALSLDAGDQPGLTLVDLGDGTQYPVTLPGAGSVRQLRGSGASGFFGFAFTGVAGSESLSSVLYVYDPRNVSGVANAILGLDGRPLEVIDWRFIDGTSTIVAQSFDQTFLLLDATGATPPKPLGAHSELLGLIPGTTTVAALDPGGVVAIDLTTGETSPLDLPVAPADAGTYPGRQVLIDDAGDHLQLFSTPLTTQPGGAVLSALWRIDATGARQIFTTAVPGSRIRDFCVSPNRQYAAVETASFDAAIDDYPALGGYVGMTTSIVDLATGSTTHAYYGFLPDWCR